MKCHKLTQSNVLVFWGQKCGATQLKEILMHIESGSFYNNLGKDHITHNIYEQYYKSIPTRDFKHCINFNSILFGRNPYYRIPSLYIDKYVMVNSPTPDKGENTQTFKEFILQLIKIGFNNKESKLRIFSGFFPITKSPYYELFDYCSKIIILEENLLPDAKLTHNPESIKFLYDISNNNDAFSEIRCIVEQQWNQKQQRQHEKANCKIHTNIENASLPELRRILENQSVTCENFFSPTLKEQFNLLYRDEFDLYSKRGISFNMT